MELTFRFHISIYVCVTVGAFLCVCIHMCSKEQGHHKTSPHFADSSEDKRNLALANICSGINWDDVSAERHEDTDVEVTNLVVGRSVKKSVPQNVTAELNIVGWVRFCQVKCLQRENGARV